MKILLADPDAAHAESLRAALSAEGWTVGTATTSDSAVDWMNQNGGCDVLVADVFLAPSDGFTLRETIQPYLPEMKTVFLSAHDVSAHAERFTGLALLPKPTEAANLVATLRGFAAPGPTAVQVKPVAATAAPRAVAATPRVAAATPTPVPSQSPAAAVATPRPAVAAAPKAVATATPRAVATPSAKPVAANPSSVAAKAVPTAKPAVAKQPSASSSKAAAIAMRVATTSISRSQSVAPKSAAAVKSVPVINAEIELPPDELVGKTIGHYQIEARIGQASMGPIYRAKQVTVGRLTRFYVLDSAKAGDPAELEKFLSNATVKARATHPLVMAIYEAGEADGVYFYSCEYIPCRSLRQLRESGGYLDETTGIEVLRVAAQAMDFFAREGLAHELLSENAILIGPGNHPRVANIASSKASREFDLGERMSDLGKIVLAALPADTSAPATRKLATLLTDPASRPESWPAFLEAIHANEPKAAPKDAYKLDAQERAAVRALDEAKKAQKKSLLVNSAISLALLIAALTAVFFFLTRDKGAEVRNLDQMVRIPAGEFIYQDGQKVTLPEFYISEHEVTIGDYAKFLDFLEKNPGKAAEFAHPEQPKGKSHVPNGWADMKELNPPMPGYYTRAKKWGRYKEAALDVNSPVFGVDWFDAYAYAKWKGQRLPTELEWEKAARGTEAFKFPWGNETDPLRANTSIDLDPDPKKGGDKDGFKRWNPVDAKKADKSPFGVVGMAGNVSEWTATYDAGPESGGDKVPVIRGGNWKNPDPSVTRRVVRLMDLQQDDALGFRTASDTPPGKN